MKDFRGLLRLTPRDLRLRGEIERTENIVGGGKCDEGES